MAVSPWVTAMGFALLLTGTTLSYIWFGEEFGKTDDPSRRVRPYHGYGAPSTFDWCEPNAGDSYVAEPWNTMSSCAYFVPAALLVSVPAARDRVQFVLLAVSLVAIGVGSMLFHATLLYAFQLLDELPMYSLTTIGSLTMWYRHSSPPTAVAVAAGSWYAVLCVVLFATPHDAAPHLVLHGVMSATFSLQFIYILTAASRTAEEAATTSAGVALVAPGTPAAVHRVCTGMLVAFAFAIVAWAADNFLCPLLHALPYGVPYPQLHALAWHVFTALGCYGVSVLLLVHNLVHRAPPVPVYIEWLARGWLPVVKVADKRAA